MSERDIKIRVVVKDDGSVALQTIGDKGEKSMAKIRKGSGEAAAATKKFADSATGAVAAVKSLAAAVGIGFVTRDIVQAGIGMERMTTAMLAAVGSSEAATKEFSFLSDEADRLGLNLERAGGAFSQLLAASKGTTLQGQGVRDIFTAVSEAATVLSLSAYETEGALRAINQMVSKGNVQAEELRGQLGERLPGAFQIAARAMGVTTMELNDMLERGAVMADEFLPKFAIELRKTFSDQLPGALDNTQQQLNRFSTALFKLKAEFASGGFLDGLLDVVDGLSSLLKDQTFRDGLADLSKHVGLFLSDLKDLPKDTLDFVDDYGTSIKAVGGFLLTVTAAQLAFNLAVRANPYILAGSALSWAAGWFKDYTDEVKKATDATGKLNDEYAAITGAIKSPELPMMASHIQGAEGSPAFLAAVARENADAMLLASHGTKTTSPVKTSTSASPIKTGLSKEELKRYAAENKAILEGSFDMDAWYGDQSDAAEAFFQEEKKRIDELWGLRESRAQAAEEAMYQEAVAAEGAENALLDVARAALPEHERAVHDVHQAYADLSAQVEQLYIIGEISKEVADTLHEGLSQRMNEDLDELAAKTDKTSAFWKSAHRNMQSVGAGFFKSMREDSDDWLAHFSDIVWDMVDQWMSAKMMMAAFGDGENGELGGLVGAGVTAISNYFSTPTISGADGVWPAANGAIFPGHFEAFANGSPYVGRPTLGLIGEGDYPEAVIPLPDGRTVPVTMTGQGGGGGGEVKISIENKGSDKQVTDAKVSFDPVGMVVAIVLEDLDSNGPIRQAMAGGI